MAPRTFSVVTSVEDPLTAERLVAVLRADGLDAFARAGGAAATGPFAATHPGFYELFVPSEAVTRAEDLLREELAQLERDAEANAAAAEEEALSGESPIGD